GMRSSSVHGTAARAIAAVTRTATAGEVAAARVPATAGPSSAAPLKLTASRVLARGRRAGATRLGIMLVNPALVSGRVTPAAATIARHTGSGARPRVATRPSIDVARISWLPTRASLRWWVRSSHAPSSGPDARAGNVYALTTRPAATGLL